MSYAGGAALANVMRTTRWVLEVDFVHKIGCHGNVPWGIEKNNIRSFIYGQISTNPANSVKIRPFVDVEISGLTEITKNIFLNKKQQQSISPSHAERVG